MKGKIDHDGQYLFNFFDAEPLIVRAKYNAENNVYSLEDKRLMASRIEALERLRGSQIFDTSRFESALVK
jgi:hypothetical protein